MKQNRFRKDYRSLWDFISSVVIEKVQFVEDEMIHNTHKHTHIHTYIQTFIHSFIHQKKKKTRKIKIKKEANKKMGEEQKSKTNFEHAVLRGYQQQQQQQQTKKKTSPMIDKKNVSFMCVQNVDNIGLDGNKNGQANEPAE